MADNGYCLAKMECPAIQNPADDHAKHPIMGGHFARRRQILKETLEAYDVPPFIREAWLAHTDSLRPLITPEADSDCDPIAARQRVRRP